MHANDIIYRYLFFKLFSFPSFCDPLIQACRRYGKPLQTNSVEGKFITFYNKKKSKQDPRVKLF